MKAGRRGEAVSPGAQEGPWLLPSLLDGEETGSVNIPQSTPVHLLHLDVMGVSFSFFL